MRVHAHSHALKNIPHVKTRAHAQRLGWLVVSTMFDRTAISAPINGLDNRAEKLVSSRLAFVCLVGHDRNNETSTSPSHKLAKLETFKIRACPTL